jgi:hypothetical protein
MHASLHECAEYGRCQLLFAERPQHFGMGKDVYGATGPEIGIPCATNAMGFAFVDQGDSVMFYGDGDGGGLAVVEGLGGWTNHEFFKMLCPDIAHGYDFHESVIDEFLQMVCISAASSLACFQLEKDRLGDHQSVRDGSKNFP